MSDETQARLSGGTATAGRSSGLATYVTAIIACRRYGVMYHAPIRPGESGNLRTR